MTETQWSDHDKTIHDGKINGRWDLKLLGHRVSFHRERPGWEAERLATCFEMMAPGMTIYDLGAEVGDFTALYGMWVGPTGTVVPVEPSPQSWPSIKTHWYANGLPPIKAFFPGFVSDVTDLSPMEHIRDPRIVDRSGWPECASNQIRPEFGFRHLAQQTADTPQITLDDLVARTGLIPDAIVMDIEGAEFSALKGCRQVLERDRPIMWVSVHPQTMRDWYEAELDDILHLMDDVEYDAELLGEDSEMYWLFTSR